MNTGVAQRSSAADEIRTHLRGERTSVDDLRGHGTRFRALNEEPSNEVMSRKGITLFIVVATAAILALTIFAVYWQSGSKQSGIGPASLRGSPAQSFTVPRLDGGAGSLNDFRGRLVVLNLWASWCPPCRAELPDLQRLYERYRSRRVVVIAVNEGESAERAGAFARALRVKFPIFLDQNQSYGRVYAALGLPTTVIINRVGTVVQGFDGALTFDQMKAAVTPLL